MMAGNPNWWSLSDMRSQAQQPSFFLSPSPSLFPQYATGSPSLPSNSSADHNQELPQSWSQLLMGGLTSEEDKFAHSHFQSKKLEYWEDQILNPTSRVPVFDVKQEFAQSSQLYNPEDDEFQTCRPSWSQIIPVSSPRSSVTNVLDFSNNNGDERNQYPEPDHSSECNSTAAGGAPKKAKVQSSSTQPPLKVKKERLGDRITALHQLVSPFGKTDTASVLFEAISHIGFLQGQIEALSSPYLGNAPANMRHQQPGNIQDAPKDLRSRGLCLVPVSCTYHVGSENGADYWAPSMGGGF